MCLFWQWLKDLRNLALIEWLLMAYRRETFFVLVCVLFQATWICYIFKCYVHYIGWLIYWLIDLITVSSPFCTINWVHLKLFVYCYCRFKDVVIAFLKEIGGEKLLAIHCTHGLNRTGYLVCRSVMFEYYSIV